MVRNDVCGQFDTGDTYEYGVKRAPGVSCPERKCDDYRTCHTAKRKRSMEEPRDNIRPRGTTCPCIPCSVCKTGSVAKAGEADEKNREERLVA
jgi:hypothetical protein